MSNRRGWWYVVSVVSLPLMLVASSGLLGAQAKDEADAALADLASAAQAMRFVLWGIVVVIVAVLAYALLR